MRVEARINGVLLPIELLPSVLLQSVRQQSVQHA